MKRSALIPPGSWPRRMGADLAAGYCGEPSVDAFLKRVGREYPRPRVNEGRRRLWLRDGLRNNSVAIPRVLPIRRLSRKGRHPLTPGLRAYYATRREHRDEKGRQAWRP